MSSSDAKSGAEQIAPGGLCAVVTGANKGIGLAIVRQLAEQGVSVVLTSRDQDRGFASVRSLKSSGLSGILFHTLDVRDSLSVASLSEFLFKRFGKLDILVNNAAISGAVVDTEGLLALGVDPDSWLSGNASDQLRGVIQHTHENAAACLDTNYFGCKRVTEALLPLLRLSPSGARIVNVSSLRSELRRIRSKDVRDELSDEGSLNEGKIEKVLERFMEDLKEGRLEEGGWPMMLPAYSMSKVALNAYTRVMARRCPEMRINCVHPGFVKTGLNWYQGVETIDEGAVGPVMLALLPPGGPSGHYFDKTVIADAEAF